jgi:hypothetical protein
MNGQRSRAAEQSREAEQSSRAEQSRAEQQGRVKQSRAAGQSRAEQGMEITIEKKKSQDLSMLCSTSLLCSALLIHIKKEVSLLHPVCPLKTVHRVSSSLL